MSARGDAMISFEVCLFNKNEEEAIVFTAVT